jgi:hypothetical protein
MGIEVVTDMWVLNQEMAEMFPAIGIGGPAVNAFTAQIYEDLPIAFARDQQVFIQKSQDRGKARQVGKPLKSADSSEGQSPGRVCVENRRLLSLMVDK